MKNEYEHSNNTSIINSAGRIASNQICSAKVVDSEVLDEVDPETSQEISFFDDFSLHPGKIDTSFKVSYN